VSQGSFEMWLGEARTILAFSSLMGQLLRAAIACPTPVGAWLLSIPRTHIRMLPRPDILFSSYQVDHGDALLFYVPNTGAP
jgi:hypothetical protein